MTAAEAVEAAKDLNFEKVWTMFQEIARRQAETDKQIKELSKESDQRQAESDKLIKELSKNIGGLNNSFGRWAEEMVSAKLWEKFKALGYVFTRGGPMKFWENDRTVAQVDMLLENGGYAMPVEIKSDLTVEDVDEHIDRIAKVRAQLDKRGDRRKLVGAVAGMVVGENVREYAQKKGLYVLVQSGDTVALAESSENFKLREW
jgi:phenylalanyl-tRNA synthetase alpha subunit